MKVRGIRGTRSALLNGNEGQKEDEESMEFPEVLGKFAPSGCDAMLGVCFSAGAALLGHGEGGREEQRARGEQRKGLRSIQSVLVPF